MILPELDDICRKINRLRLLNDKERVHCVVVEHDWPEYELVWKMIQDRVEGKPNEVESSPRTGSTASGDGSLPCGHIGREPESAGAKER